MRRSQPRAATRCGAGLIEIVVIGGADIYAQTMAMPTGS